MDALGGGNRVWKLKERSKTHAHVCCAHVVWLDVSFDSVAHARNNTSLTILTHQQAKKGEEKPSKAATAAKAAKSGKAKKKVSFDCD